MRATTHHHCGLRVTDIDRAGRFYIEAFDGHFLATPFELSGDFAETVMEGPPGVTFKVCMVGFADGSVIEMFEFVDPVHPVEVVHPTRGNIIHYGVQVDPEGTATPLRNAICLHEEDYGMLWKHVDGRNRVSETRRSRRMVVSSIATEVSSTTS